MPRTKDQADRNVGGNAKSANKDSNGDKQSASDKTRAANAAKTVTAATPAGPKQVAASSPAAKATPAPAAKVVSSSPKPSAPAPAAPAKATVDKSKSTPAPKPTPTPAPKPSYAVVASRPSTPAPKPQVVSAPKPGTMVTPASAAALKTGTMKTVSTPAGPKKVSAFPSFAAAGSSPTYKAGDQGRIKAGTPVTASMVKAGMTKAPVGSPISATDALRANQMAVKYGANPTKTVSTPAGPKVVDPMKSSFAKAPTTAGRGSPTGGAPITSEEILAGIGRPLFGPDTTAGYTGEMYPAGGPLRIRVSPPALEPPPSMQVSMLTQAALDAMSPKSAAAATPAVGLPSIATGGGGVKQTSTATATTGGGGGGGGAPNIQTGQSVPTPTMTTPRPGGGGERPLPGESLAAVTDYILNAGGGGGSGADAGTPLLPGAGSGTGATTGSGSGAGASAGAGSGAASGTSAGTGIASGVGGGGGGGGAGSGGGSGGGVGTGTGAGVGPGAGSGGGVGGGGAAPPTGPSGCPPGYYLYTRPDGTTVCVPDTSGLPMVRPVVAPYYQPYGVASLEGYTPYVPGQT